MAQADDDESLPVTLLTIRENEAFLIQQIPPKAKSSMVLCEQWPYRSPKDNPKLVIPIELELVDKYSKGLWIYLKRTNLETNKKETYLHFSVDRDLPTVEQAYDSSRYYQLSIPKPGGSANEMIYLGLRDDSKQLQDELLSYWRQKDAAKEVKEMPDADWALDDNTQISIGGKASDNSSDKKDDNNSGGAALMSLAAPKSKSKKSKNKSNNNNNNNNDKSSNDPNSSDNPKNQPKQSVFDDSFGNDFDNAFGDVAKKDDNSSKNDNNSSKENNTNNKKDAGWSDFDF